MKPKNNYLLLLVALAALFYGYGPDIELPDVVPKPEPSPFDAQFVLIKTEMQDGLDAADAIAIAEVRRYCDANKIDYRFYDHEMSEQELRTVSPAIQKAYLRNHSELPWLVISGKTFFEGPFPETSESVEKLLEEQFQ